MTPAPIYTDVSGTVRLPDDLNEAERALILSHDRVAAALRRWER